MIKDLLKPFQHRKPTIMGEEQFRKFGVLVPLVYIQDEIHILFEVRSQHLRSQPGDICFPGGKKDQTDVDAQTCALRETREEIGIPSSEIKDIVPLDYIISDAGGIIYPYAGYILSLDSLEINHDEVKEVFTVPLQYFVQHEPKRYHVHLKVEPEKDFPYELIYNGENYNWRRRGSTEIFYQYKNYVIWGLTAKILTHFLKIAQVK